MIEHPGSAIDAEIGQNHPVVPVRCRTRHKTSLKQSAELISNPSGEKMAAVESLLQNLQVLLRVVSQAAAQSFAGIKKEQGMKILPIRPRGIEKDNVFKLRQKGEKPLQLRVLHAYHGIFLAQRGTSADAVGPDLLFGVIDGADEHYSFAR
jgi:hypothetical protein